MDLARMIPARARNRFNRASGAGWSRLVLPGVLLGLWGYIIGTPIGIAVMEFLRP